MLQKLLGRGVGACPQTPLDAQALSGLQNVAVGHVFDCYG